MTGESFPFLFQGERLRGKEKLQRGAGPKFHPHDVDSIRRHLAPRIAATESAAEAIPENMRGERVVVELTLFPNYIASTWHPSALLANLDLVPIGSRIGNAEYRTGAGLQDASFATKTLHLAGAADSLSRLGDLLADVDPTPETAEIQEQIVRIADVTLPDPSRVNPDYLTSDGPGLGDFEVVLHRAVDGDGEVTTEAEIIVLGRLQEFVESIGGVLDRKWARRSGGLIHAPVRLSARSAAQLADFNAVRSAQPFPQFPALNTVSTLPLAVKVAPQTAAPKSSQTVAVFDLGADIGHPAFAGVVAQTDCTSEPPDPDGVAHGTLVVSSLLFGAVVPGLPFGQPNCRVHMFRIGPAPASTGNRSVYWALDEILKVLRRDSFDIAVITTGPSRPVGRFGDAPSAWTAELDLVAKQRGTLIVTAAGNTGTPDPRPADGADRIEIPADSVNGLSVGAAMGTAGSWERASYSSRGPGRAGATVQPTVMAFGGDAQTAFIGAIPGNSVGRDFGTSFAAPLVAGELAVLRETLGPLSRPETLRAFAVHVGDKHPTHDPTSHGFGLFPQDIIAELQGDASELTVLYQLELERNAAASIPVPWVPAAGNLSTAWTVAYMSSVDQTNWPEYTGEGIEISWRPNANRFRMNPPKGTTGADVKIDLSSPADVTTYQRLLAAGWRRTNPQTSSRKGTRTEQTLRDDGKWETTIHEVVSHRASSLRDPRLWFNYLARKDGVLLAPDDSSTLDVSVLVTVRAAKGSGFHAAATASGPFSKLPVIAAPLTVGATPASG